MKRRSMLLALALKAAILVEALNTSLCNSLRKPRPGLARTPISCIVLPWTFSCTVLGNLDQSWMVFQNGWCWLGPSEYSSPTHTQASQEVSKIWLYCTPSQQVAILNRWVGQFSIRARLLESTHHHCQHIIAISAVST